MTPALRTTALVIASALAAAPAMAGDPLDDVQGTEGWVTPTKPRRHPVETQRSILLQAELAQTASDLEADRAWMKRQQEEQAAESNALQEYRASRRAPRSPAWLSSEERRLESAAERALHNPPPKTEHPRAAATRERQDSAADAAFERAPDASSAPRENARAATPAPTAAPAAAADSAFDSPSTRQAASPHPPAQPRRQAASAPPPAATAGPAAAADSAFDAPSPTPAQPRRQVASEPAPAARSAAGRSRSADATSREEIQAEDEAGISRDEKRAADRAASERRKRESEEAKRLGGHLDASGQFVDPDLEGP